MVLDLVLFLLLEQPLSRILKAVCFPNAIKNSTMGKQAAVSMVIIKEEPISLYHSEVKSGYWPVNGRNDRKVC